VMLERLVLFGATGDLAGRYLLPALAALHAAGALPDGFSIAAASIEDWDDERFRSHAARRLEEHAADQPSTARDAIVRSLRYERIDFDDPAAVGRAIGGDHPVGAYLALPTAVMPAGVKALAAAGLPDGSRIALEKPFGEDLASAEALNALLLRCVAGEEAVFRVDHFLGMAPVQNVLGLRFANRMLEPVWNGTHVERVEIFWDETLTLEGRASFYDRAGALKDVIQNHLLQVMTLVATDRPARLGEDLRDRKLDVLRSVRPLSGGDTRRARYTAGRIGDRAVPDYAAEDGVDPARGTETLAELTLRLDADRWAGTPFFLRAAKAVGRERKEVVVRFRAVEDSPFAGDHPKNELRIGLAEPGDITLELAGSTPSHLTPLALRGVLAEAELPEYGRVLLDFLSGGSTLSVRGDVAEEAWRIVDPVLEAWAGGRVPLDEYPAGSDGVAR
jgi:glucose-6-phosphate 1-dehydrogenase